MDESLSLWGLFVSSVISSTLLPGGSELVVVALLLNELAEPLAVWSVATLGNTLGGMSSWCIGYGLGYKFSVDSGNTNSKLNHRAVEWVRRRGAPILLLSWLPVVGDPLCVAAGWLKISFITAMIYITIGKAIRYAVIVWLV